MAMERRRAGTTGQDNGIGAPLDDGDKSLVLGDRDRRWFREAIEESGVKKDAIAQCMTEAGCRMDPQYLSKLLSGEKTLTTKHLDALPDDVAAIYRRKGAESYGFIVVERVGHELALKHLVSGIVSLFSPFTGVPKLRMAKMTLEP
jgi:hypothetical protein